jgi:hypothetical protein
MVKLAIAAQIVLITAAIKKDIVLTVIIALILLALSHVKTIHILGVLFLILTQQPALVVQEIPAQSAKIKQQGSQVAIVDNATILKLLIVQCGFAIIIAKFVFQF